MPTCASHSESINLRTTTRRSHRGQMKEIPRSRGGQVAVPPPTTMKLLHLTTSSRDERDFKTSISSLDLKSASAVLIDMNRASLCDERLQRRRELSTSSVSLSSATVSTLADDRLPAGEDGYPTLPVRPSIPRRPGPVQGRPRGGRPRAVTPQPAPGKHRSGGVMDDAAMRGAGRDTSATRCSTSSTTAETATDRCLTSADDACDMSRDLGDRHDVMFSRQPTRRRPGRSFADVTQQCHCRSTSGFVADRKFRSYRKHVDADDCQPVTTSTTFLHHPERYLKSLVVHETQMLSYVAPGLMPENIQLLDFTSLSAFKVL